MNIQIVFHGKLSELTETGQKYYNDVKYLADLKLRIRDDFPQLSHINHMVFLNDRKRSGNVRLKDNDIISLFPAGDV
jgi:hypothetical protein